MGTLCTFSCPLICQWQYQNVSTKRLLSRHHKMPNQRYRMELHGIGKAPQRQDMGTAPFGRKSSCVCSTTQT
uniref:Uncharacterized protein n=1 Tax=Picea sitchensis TaxID=3332 RepID=A9NZ58_PICSI|nr:unknown [Picea sitchensis]